MFSRKEEERVTTVIIQIRTGGGRGVLHGKYKDTQCWNKWENHFRNC